MEAAGLGLFMISAAAVTAVFFRLGKIHGLDACSYAVAQFSGGLIGLLLAAIGDRQGDRTSARQFCCHGTGEPWDMDRVRRRNAPLVWAQARGADRFDSAQAQCLDGPSSRGRLWRRTLCVKHRSPHEHESGPEFRLRACRASLDRFLGIPHGAAFRHAARRGMLCPFSGAHRVLCAKLHHHSNERRILPLRVHAVIPASGLSLPRTCL